MFILNVILIYAYVLAKYFIPIHETSYIYVNDTEDRLKQYAFVKISIAFIVAGVAAGIALIICGFVTSGKLGADFQLGASGVAINFFLSLVEAFLCLWLVYGNIFSSNEIEDATSAISSPTEVREVFDFSTENFLITVMLPRYIGIFILAHGLFAFIATWIFLKRYGGTASFVLNILMGFVGILLILTPSNIIDISEPKFPRALMVTIKAFFLGCGKKNVLDEDEIPKICANMYNLSNKNLEENLMSTSDIINLVIMIVVAFIEAVRGPIVKKREIAQAMKVSVHMHSIRQSVYNFNQDNIRLATEEELPFEKEKKWNKMVSIAVIDPTIKIPENMKKNEVTSRFHLMDPAKFTRTLYEDDYNEDIKYKMKLLKTFRKVKSVPAVIEKMDSFYQAFVSRRKSDLLERLNSEAKIHLLGRGKYSELYGERIGHENSDNSYAAGTWSIKSLTEIWSSSSLAICMAVLYFAVMLGKSFLEEATSFAPKYTPEMFETCLREYEQNFFENCKKYSKKTCSTFYRCGMKSFGENCNFSNDPSVKGTNIMNIAFSISTHNSFRYCNSPFEFLAADQTDVEDNDSRDFLDYNTKGTYETFVIMIASLFFWRIILFAIMFSFYYSSVWTYFFRFFSSVIIFGMLYIIIIINSKKVAIADIGSLLKTIITSYYGEMILYLTIIFLSKLFEKCKSNYVSNKNILNYITKYGAYKPKNVWSVILPTMGFNRFFKTTKILKMSCLFENPHIPPIAAYPLYSLYASIANSMLIRDTRQKKRIHKYVTSYYSIFLKVMMADNLTNKKFGLDEIKISEVKELKKINTGKKKLKRLTEPITYLMKRRPFLFASDNVIFKQVLSDLYYIVADRKKSTPINYDPSPPIRPLLIYEPLCPCHENAISSYFSESDSAFQKYNTKMEKLKKNISKYDAKYGMQYFTTIEASPYEKPFLKRNIKDNTKEVKVTEKSKNPHLAPITMQETKNNGKTKGGKPSIAIPIITKKE